MINRRHLLTALTAFGATLRAANTVLAQASYPTRPIKVVVPFPAGGPADGMARVVADRLGQTLHQGVIVDNRAGGAGGTAGAKVVATAEPDGYTILLTAPGPLTIAPAVNKTLDYQPLTAFTPVALLIVTPLVICVHPSVPVTTLAGLVAYAKANPGKITFGSPSYGTAPHLLTEMLKLETGIDIVHVPYRGTAPAINDLIAGRVQMYTDTTTAVIPQIEAGNLRPLAVTTATRSVKLPDVPTTAEAGYPKLRASYWLGVVAPSGTPAEIVHRLNQALNESLRRPETSKRFEELGAEIAVGTPEAFGKLLHDELAMWMDVTAATGIKVD